MAAAGAPSLPPVSLSRILHSEINEPPSFPDPLERTLADAAAMNGQNHDRDTVSNQSSLQVGQARPDTGSITPPPALETEPEVNDPQHAEEDASTDRGDSESEGDEEDTGSEQWYPIAEDKSVPCDDEMAYIVRRGEQSALDHAYWEKKTFFDVDDPEIIPGERGRIDWLVEGFNGTKQDPNRELLMRSQVLRLGGYDWCIKLYPKGNDSDYLSAYIECVTMAATDFQGDEEWANPPLPCLTGRKRPLKRKTLAVQLSLVMYNPAEPRVHEHRKDAHQFTKSVPDFGWKRYSRRGLGSLGYREHGQRQAILRDDKLAFAAFLRIIEDPTNCLWAHELKSAQDSIDLTGLRPFVNEPMLESTLPLLHYVPFRDLIYRDRNTNMTRTNTTSFFASLLWTTMTRKCSRHFGDGGGAKSSYARMNSVVRIGHFLHLLKSEHDPIELAKVFGPLDPRRGSAFCGNRLRTRDTASIQAAVDQHPSTLATPAFLTLELERRSYDRKERKWYKLTNRVEMEEKIQVQGKSYTLFGFLTHTGDLSSHSYNIYVRPRGPGNVWCAYRDNMVTCLTRKQAVDKHSGHSSRDSRIGEKPQRAAQRGHSWSEEHDEVAQTVYYVLDGTLEDIPREETWHPPQHIRKNKAKDDPSLSERSKTIATCDEETPLTQEHLESSLHLSLKRRLTKSLGHETPSNCITDGEDTLMSDIDDEAASASERDDDNDEDIDHMACSTASLANANANPTITLDYFGHDYYHGQLLDPSHHPSSLVDPIYHGHGHLISLNGDEYTGFFFHHRKTGSGTMTYSRTGDTYTGSWLDDIPHGAGIYTEASTGNVFEGHWKHGRRTGAFVLRGTVTEEDKGVCSICYEREISTAFYDCGHVLACRECAGRIESCPVCRRRVVGRLELFGVKMRFE